METPLEENLRQSVELDHLKGRELKQREKSKHVKVK